MKFYNDWLLTRTTRASYRYQVPFVSGTRQVLGPSRPSLLRFATVY